ncbi:MAG: TauD/TfdA family dioxygenase [Bdellovibrionales bacterium]|nr:TauD/TfdA family dioxygenase [Bdellovibrionales bacterium]NQZ18465.1 TauD/TfdA family dioxygenase [Bdellovibrionales bacterium]
MEYTPITPVFGAKINSLSFESLMSISKEDWRQLLYDKNIIIIENIEMNKAEFVEFSHKLGRPWLQPLYVLHGEKMEDDGVVNWSDQTGLKKRPLPWHTDNPWHPEWKNPIRILYSRQIPDPESGVLHYLDLAHFLNHFMSAEEMNWLSQFKVLIQDYRKKERKYWYPLVYSNPVSGRISLHYTAMDLDSSIFGLQKEPDYKKGETFLLKIESSSGEQLPLNYLSEYIKRSLETEGCHFYQKWAPNMIQIMSNLDSAHMRTRVSESPLERKIWRKTIAHEYQVVSENALEYVAN